MTFQEKYHAYVNETLSAVWNDNQKEIEQAAHILYNAECGGHCIYTFGTGHSHMLGQDIYARAGGFAKIKPIVEIELTLATHPTKSTQIERLAGYADVLEQLYHVKEGDVIIAASNSGRNALVIEYLLRMKQKGARIVAITSLCHSQKVKSRHESGKKLCDIADVVLDNKAPYGDAGIALNETVSMGPVSTLSGCFLSQCIVGRMAELRIQDSRDVPVFRARTAVCADEYNQELFDRYVL